ncbi:MAG: MBL fold metallo-hydrolase [Ardenticatenia bacterium]|nr:MBL fold metallo-hydrolase [Ardenticatenia bacterium]
MEIKWYGHACFRVREKSAVVITDPFPPSLGYYRPRMRADIVTISHYHKNHCALKGFQGSPFVIDAPGEYEVKGVFVTGIRTYHDRQQGRVRGYNTVYLFRFDGLTVCHLGDLGHIPNQEQVEELSEVDILLIPVGGAGTLNAAMAAEVISLIEPRVVVPMHYRTEAYANGLDPVEPFLKAMGAKEVPRHNRLTVSSRASLPEETQIVLLTFETK